MKTFLSFIIVLLFAFSRVFAEGVPTLPIPGTIQVADYSDQSGLTINDHIGYVNDGDWVEYQINVESTGYYNLVFNAASSNSSARCIISLDEDSLGVFIAPNTGSFTNYVEDSICLKFIEGVHTLRLRFAGLAFNTEYLRFAHNNDLILVPDTIQAADYADQSGLSISEYIGQVNVGDWVKYLLDINTAGKYVFTFHVTTSNGDPTTCNIEVDGDSVQFFDCPYTGGWANYTDASVDVDLPAGQHELRLLFTGNGFNTQYVVCEEKAASFTLNVTDEGAAISAATVMFDDVEYTTDANGVLVLTDLGFGNYEYTVSANGYKDTTNTVTLSGDDVVDNIVMSESITTLLSSSVETNITIYPNPANLYFSIDQDYESLVICDMSGRFSKSGLWYVKNIHQ